MRKIFAVLVLVAALSGTSWASLIYTTSSGNLGTIDVKGITSIDAPAVQYTGLGDNTLVAAFWNGHESNVIAVNRHTDTTASEDTALVFRSSSLSRPLNTNGKSLSDIYNAQKVISTRNGRGLIFASRENASIVELDTETLTHVRSYKYKAASGDDTPHMQDIILDYSQIYGLVDTGNAGSVFLVFDGQLKEHVSNYYRRNFDQRAASISLLSNSRIAVATSSGVGVMRTSGLAMIAETDQPAKALCQDDGNGFYFITQEESGAAYINRLYHYSYDSQSVAEVYQNEYESEGNCKLIRFMKKKMIAAIMGENIVLLNASNGEVLQEFDSDDLDGVPVSIATGAASGDNYESSSGSCDVTSAGMILLLACSVLLLPIQREGNNFDVRTK